MSEPTPSGTTKSADQRYFYEYGWIGPDEDSAIFTAAILDLDGREFVYGGGMPPERKHEGFPSMWGRELDRANRWRACALLSWVALIACAADLLGWL